MTYCMSDLHGERDRFVRMLEQIHFSPADRLYVIGDVIDRGPDSLELLRQVMGTKNMTLLLGNHEAMCLELLRMYRFSGPKRRKLLWESGSSTYRRIVDGCTFHEREAITGFLAALPDHLDLEVEGEKFHLVHAWPGEEQDTRIWRRPRAEDPAPFPDRTALIGHTPTRLFQPDEPLRIWHGQGVIDLDCGCGHHWPERRLGCLRLEDLREFYA